MQPEIFSREAMLSRPAHLINRIARLFLRLGEPRFQAIGFTTAQMPVLGSLKDGKPLSQKELARRAMIEQPSMAQMLARMKRDGLVTVSTDPSDKRGQLVTLSESALARLPEVEALMIEGNRETIAGLNEEEVATLVRLLRHVIGNLEAIAARNEEQGK